MGVVMGFLLKEGRECCKLQRRDVCIACLSGRRREKEVVVRPVGDLIAAISTWTLFSVRPIEPLLFHIILTLHR